MSIDSLTFPTMSPGVHVFIAVHGCKVQKWQCEAMASRWAGAAGRAPAWPWEVAASVKQKLPCHHLKISQTPLET